MRATTVSISFLFFLSVVLIFAATTTPDVDAYINELKNFTPSHIRLDYLSWATLWFFGVDSVEKFHIFSIFIFFLILAFCNYYNSNSIYALGFLMPMALGSQVRVLLAATIFIITCNLIRSKSRIFWASVLASTFHFSFAFIFFYPVFIVAPDLIALVLPDSIFGTYEAKVNAYLGKKAVVPSSLGYSFLLSMLIVNFIVLVKEQDRRYVLVAAYILIFPLVGEVWWETFRRSCELMLFVCYPFFFRNYRGLSIYNSVYFAMQAVWFSSNLVGYAKLVWRQEGYL